VLAVFGDPRLPPKPFGDATAKRIGGFRLTVGHECLDRRILEAAKPSQEFALVGMGRQHVETGNLCAHRNELSVDLHFARTIAQGCAPRPAGLETGLTIRWSRSTRSANR